MRGIHVDGAVRNLRRDAEFDRPPSRKKEPTYNENCSNREPA